MRRFLAALALVTGLSLSLSAVPSCASSGGTAGCDQGQLAVNPAFLLPFEDRVDTTGCTVTAFVYDQNGGRQRMQCVAYAGDCLCQGGGLPGIYEVDVFDGETGLEIDDAEVTVTAAAALECRTSEVTRPFDGAFRHSYYGAGGAGGAGGAAP